MISNFTRRGFGVIASIDTVVFGVFGERFLSKARVRPFARSAGSWRRSSITFSLPSSSV